ncbi:MAG: DUF2357 domain-containing protein, partial [Candidatus Alkaliphilus sp. MAG34]
SGSRQVELVSIETEKIYFTIKGRFKSTDFDYPKEIYKDSFSCECFPVDDIIDINLYSDKILFYEYTDYQIIIESKGNHELKFFHENKLIRDQITYTTKSKRVMAGSINFRSDVGLTELVVYLDNREYLMIRLEVFPSKLDYKTDYLNILLDVNEEIHNLAFEFLKRTYFNMALRSEEGSSLTEFYSILNYIYHQLIKFVNIIVQQPHHDLVKQERIMPYHKIRNTTKDTIKWLEKNPTQLFRKNNRLIPLKALEVKKISTTDTYENQFLKHMLESIIKKLESLKLKYMKLDRIKDELLIKKINSMTNELNAYLKITFLNKVGDFQIRDSFSLVLRMAPGYRDIYKYYLMLKKGLILYGDVFKLSVKDLALLYEYWCFIKINSILRKKYDLIQNDLIQVSTNGVFVTLKKGTTTEVKYQNPRNGEIFTISYNLGKNSCTIPRQKPDNIFSITKDERDLSYNYIFDAKYRVNFADEGSRYKERYSLPGPQESDINAMHRYRDAIVYANRQDGKMERDIFGAFVLFPYSNEEEYKKHDFYKSIELVNVGGIPFLPNSTKLVEKFLDELIEESSPSSYERSLKQRGHSYYLKSSYFNERTVLLGSLSGREQLTINLKNKFYHTRLSNVDLKKHLIKTIAIGQSKNLFGDEAGVRYYGSVKDIKIVKRNEIQEIPRESDELYIRFEIEEWKQLDNPIKVEGFQVITVLYTSDYLLKNAKTVSELCIKDEEEFRLWMELKRLDSEVTAMSEDKIHKGSNIKGFSIGGRDIYIIEDKIRITENGKVQEHLRSEFRKNPKLVVRLIRRA